MVYKECPKCGYKRGPEDAEANPLICPACGIAYQKWLDRQKGIKTRSQREIEDLDTSRMPESSFFRQHEDEPERVQMAVFAGRAITWVGLFIWGWSFILAGVDWESIGGSFMHNINLPFHEFGHLFFRPFGEFMTILGGSLFQVLWPLGLMAAFILQRGDQFAASVMLWWAGQSLIDVSPYIADAKDRVIPLVGGLGEEFHDWGNILAMTNSLDKAKSLARFSFSLGAMVMLLSFAWGAYVLHRQSQNIAK